MFNNLRKLSVLFAILLLAGMVAGCSSDDSSGGGDSSDAGGTTDRGRGGTDTGGGGTLDASVTDTGGGGGVTDTGGGGGTEINCAEIPTNPEHGTVCTGAEGECSQGVCAAPPEQQATCSQVCVPTQCEDACTGGDVCIPLADSPETPDTDESELGVCGAMPTGEQGNYDQCGDAGLCAEGLTCLVQNTGDTNGICYPTCTGPEDTSCPAKEGIAGQCALGTTDGRSFCALICTPGATASCPTGMTCVEVPATGGGTGGICQY